MSHDDTAINGLTYIENLIRVPEKIAGVPTPNWANTTTYLTTGINMTAAQLNAFFVPYNNSTKLLPETFDGFIAALTAYGATLGKTVNATAVTDAFLTDYMTWTNSDASGVFPSTTSTDWSLIVPPPSKADLTNQMKAWFAHFIDTYPFQPNGSVASTSNVFFSTASNELTVTAFLQSSPTLVGVTGVSATILGRIPRYQKIYEALFPGAAPGDFATRLNEFYQDQIAEKGYFNPSQALDNWSQDLLEEFGKTLAANPFTPSSLVSANFKKVLVLDRIYAIVADLLGSLQRIAAVQANRLVILSNWQRAYTDSLSQLHTFLQNDGTYLATRPTDVSGAELAFARTQANDKTNATLRELMQSNRAIVSDDAKALQSNVNQTNDAVSQQANAATAIIQELNTLLAAIFR